MDLEKAFDRVDRRRLWHTLRVYGVGGHLLEGIRSFYENASASVPVNGELSENASVEVSVRQGCVMSPWLFNIYICLCSSPFRTGPFVVRARAVAGLYVDATVLLAESEGMLQRIVDEFDRVCTWRTLKVNAGRSKVMVFERAREHTIDFAKPYKVWSKDMTGCKIWLGRRRWRR